MNKFCDYKPCQYYTVQPGPELRAKMQPVKCPLCLNANYCGNRCRDLDWYAFNFNPGLAATRVSAKCRRRPQIDQGPATTTTSQYPQCLPEGGRRNSKLFKLAKKVSWVGDHTAA